MAKFPAGMVDPSLAPRAGSRRRRGVTFTETLITAALLGLVLVVVALGIHSVQGDLKHRQVWDLLATLDKALTAYHEATGTWPFPPATQPADTEPNHLPSKDDPAESSRRVIAALADVPASREILDTIPMILRVPPEGAELGKWGTVRDAWGRPLRCLTARSRVAIEWQAVAANHGKPIFISAGVDGQFTFRDGVADADNLRSDQMPR
ncbi:MAG: hypothetical protein GXY44_12590 [Phycisphaerales bacterium]|nr:hypothetical protein [Phycisphaerales bacterium]